MIASRPFVQRTLPTIIIAALFAGAAILGTLASLRILVLLLLIAVGIALLRQPGLALPAVVLVALIGPIEFSSGTAVMLNPVSLFVPALVVLCTLALRDPNVLRASASVTYLPLVLFLASGLLSLVVGNALWDPAIPRADNLLIVQLAQWTIFAFSAGAFWLTANLGHKRPWLETMTVAFLVIGGGLAIAITFFSVGAVVGQISTLAPFRAPFWMLLTAVAGGQLLFNEKLNRAARAGLVAILLAAVYQSFVSQQEAISNWVGVGAAALALVWLKWRRARGFVIAAILILAFAGLLFPAVFEFAGGDQEWNRSGASRLVLIQRVVEVTMRNPILGLGPASYRAYANSQPLAYGGAYWVAPLVNSHNNYVDLFAHTGVIGLCLLAWFFIVLAREGRRVTISDPGGFGSGYANGTLAALVGALVLMLLLDWILPFVYNVGFAGFQASVLVWLFLGGIVALRNRGCSPVSVP